MNALVVHLLLLYKNFAFDFHHIVNISHNSTGSKAGGNGSGNGNKWDCEIGQIASSIRRRAPCFSGNVKTSLVVHEGDSVELMCFIYNVDFTKTLVSSNKHLCAFMLMRWADFKGTHD